MTYDQAVQQGYGDAVKAVNDVQADYSGRLLADPDLVEFTAHHSFADNAGDECVITAYYYQTKADLAKCEDGDLGALDWLVDRYEVV